MDIGWSCFAAAGLNFKSLVVAVGVAVVTAANETICNGIVENKFEIFIFIYYAKCKANERKWKQKYKAQKSKVQYASETLFTS